MRSPYLLGHLIEDAAERDPDRVAFRCRSQSVTYAGLEHRSSLLSATLQELGVKRSDRVGILLNKSIDAVVAVYGIMGAGAAYVPIDPLAPVDRVEFQLRDAGIEVLVTESRHASTVERLVRVGTPLRVVVGTGAAGVEGVEQVGWDDLRDGAVDRATLMEQDLCYVLYTSGSTGTPKGIMHTHRSALSWANVSADTYGIGPDDVISNYAPLHFDLSTLDLYAGARGGATVVMVPEEHMRLPASLARLIADERLTLFYTVPMALVQLARPGVIDGLDLSALTRVLFGGEPMPMKHLATIAGLIPTARFHNVYGPTEVNGCTHHPVTADDLTRESLPIGTPYPNVEVRVVGDDRREVPTGEVGELLVRSATMMKGYWNRPDLDERAFVLDQRLGGRPDVFHATGDYVHVDEDGLLRFHGRRDRQVKVRGYRVELDEIEALLLTHEHVRECAVFGVAGDDGPVIEIRAAVVLGGGASAGEDGATTGVELRRYLATLLPSYAVPTRIEVMEDFPRTTSGKIHRRVLAARPANRPKDTP